MLTSLIILYILGAIMEWDRGYETTGLPRIGMTVFWPVIGIVLAAMMVTETAVDLADRYYNGD